MKRQRNTKFRDLATSEIDQYRGNYGDIRRSTKLSSRDDFAQQVVTLRHWLVMWAKVRKCRGVNGLFDEGLVKSPATPLKCPVSKPYDESTPDMNERAALKTTEGATCVHRTALFPKARGPEAVRRFGPSL